MSRRTERVNNTLRRELGAVISGTLRDPRLPLMTSVTDVECTSDFAEAWVSVSVLGSEADQAHAIEALRSAAGLLRHELAARISTRQIPRLHFKIDTSIQKAADLVALIDRVAAEDRKRPVRRPPDAAPGQPDGAADEKQAAPGTQSP